MTLNSPTRLGLLASAFLLSSQGALAVPITLSNPGYWLDTVGANTLGIAGGGTAAGLVTTLFVATATPGAASGTTATATLGGAPTNSPTVDATGLWARRVANPSAAQLQPLTVTFQNGTDTASFYGQSLVGVTPVALAQNLAVNASANASSPTVTWSLPSAAGFEIDAVQLVFYSDTTNLEIGTRQLLSPTATSFTFGQLLPAGLELTVNVRLIDYVNSAAPFSEANILAESRAYVNYTVPAVPEPASAALLLLGLGALGMAYRRRRR